MLHLHERIRTVICIILVLVLLTSGSCLAASVMAKVSSGWVAVFSAPEISTSTFMGCLSKGDIVQVTAVKGYWCRIEGNGIVAYTLTPYLSKVDTTPKYIIGYTNRDTVAYATPSSSSKQFCKVAKGTKVYVIGYSGNYWKVCDSKASVIAYIPNGHLSENPPSSSSVDVRDQVIKVDWFDAGRKLVSPGSYYYLYDIGSSSFIRVKYTCGSNHMDIEPATATDTALLKAAYGGNWSWDSRSVILIADGYFIAAAINGMPHGSTDTISGNGMDGVVCLHMTNSLTHGTESVNENHQEAIEAAYRWAHS